MRSLLLAAALLAVPTTAHAFCGFYVAGSDKPMFNDATQVVLMRSGTRTVLSMQNNYKGPPEAFAMVIPVPTVLHDGDVKILDPEVFEVVERMGSPRLVEYWEQDPCTNYGDEDESGGTGTAMALEEGKMGKKDSDTGVTIEAQFTVGEYQVVILSATDSTGLDKWLKREKYQIPTGAEPLLRPYVEGGSKFFVAKVDPKKVKFVDGRAQLSPIRFHYDSDTFNLPIRLGLANSSGAQDLIVNILAPNQRYEVANYPNVTIPTNITVKEAVRDKFAQFYVALFDATLEKNPSAVVTEYSWDASSCDPCPGPTLDYADFQTLGADVLKPSNEDLEEGRMGKGGRRWGGGGFTLTRLHARYGKDLKDDLVFKEADPIVGGREHVVDAKTGKLEEGARKDSYNNFQARYAIRHPWTGPIACANPIRNRWGGKDGMDVWSQPPPRRPTRQTGQYQMKNKQEAETEIKPATDLAFAPRGMKLETAVEQDIPELNLKAVAGAIVGVDATKPPAADGKPVKKTGCGCASGDASGGLLFGLFGLAFLIRRRR
jgi:MYXO-CTERM domain-containing protein